MATLPCPCGYAGLRDGRCTCTPRQVIAYKNRLSGPLLDRFDLRVFLKPVPAEALWDDIASESSAAVRERVVRARARQAARFGPDAVSKLNGIVPDASIRRAARYTQREKAFLTRIVAAHGLSARAARRLERVAMTIADLAEADRVEDVHLMEALGFRLGNEFESQVDEALARTTALRQAGDAGVRTS